MKKASLQPVKKSKRMAQQLVTRIVVMAVVVAALAGGMIWSDGLQASAMKQRDTAQRNLANIRQETSNLDKEIENLGASAQIYADLSEKRDAMNFVVDAQNVRALMKSLKEQNHITTLNIELAEGDELTLANFSSDVLEPTKLHAVVNLGGISDQHIFQFVRGLQTGFPGIIHVRKLSLQKRRDMDLDVLRQISQGNAIETVSGTLEFDWFGFNEKDVAQESTAQQGQ